MDRYQKFLRQADKKLRKRITDTMALFVRGDWSTIDVLPLKGFPDYYRCRVGNVRLIGRKDGSRIIMVDVDWRSSVYKRLK